MQPHKHDRVITTLVWLSNNSAFMHHDSIDSYLMFNFPSNLEKNKIKNQTSNRTNHKTQKRNTSFSAQLKISFSALYFMLCTTSHIFNVSSHLFEASQTDLDDKHERTMTSRSRICRSGRNSATGASCATLHRGAKAQIAHLIRLHTQLQLDFRSWEKYHLNFDPHFA